MATQSRNCYAKALSRALWLLLLLALVGACRYLAPASPRVSWSTINHRNLFGFSPDGKHLVTTTDSWQPGSIQVWDVESAKLTFEFSQASIINQIEISPDSRFVAALNDGHLVLKDIATGEELLDRYIGVSASFQFWPDNKHIVFEENDESRPPKLHFWNIETNCEDATLPGSTRRIAAGSDGKTFAQWHAVEWTFDRIQFWKLGEGPQVVIQERQFDVPFQHIEFSGNLETFVTSNELPDLENVEIAVWDSNTGGKLATATYPHRAAAMVGFSADERYLYLLGADEAIRLDLSGGLKQMPMPAGWNLTEWWNRDWESPDGKLLLIAQPDGAELLDAVTLTKRGTLHKEGDRPPVRVGMISGLWLPHFAFSEDSKMVICTGLVISQEEPPPMFSWLADWLGIARPIMRWGDPVARLYDTGTASEVTAFHHCTHALFSPDSRLIATAHIGGTIRIWDAPPGKSLGLVIGVAVGVWLVLIAGALICRNLIGYLFRLPDLSKSLPQ
jgi:WD40 repeat protein